LLIYVSRLVISATEFLRISSGDNILNCIPTMREGAVLVLDLFDIVRVLGIEKGYNIMYIFFMLFVR